MTAAPGCTFACSIGRLRESWGNSSPNSWGQIPTKSWIKISISSNGSSKMEGRQQRAGVLQTLLLPRQKQGNQYIRDRFCNRGSSAVIGIRIEFREEFHDAAEPTYAHFSSTKHRRHRGN